MDREYLDENALEGEDYGDEGEGMTTEKYLELIWASNLDEAFNNKEGDESYQYSNKWMTVKTFLTFNTFLYGFPQEYCENDTEHDLKAVRAYHYLGGDVKKFICEHCMKIKYPDQVKQDKDFFKDIYDQTKWISSVFKDVGYLIRSLAEMGTFYPIKEIKNKVKEELKNKDTEAKLYLIVKEYKELLIKYIESWH